MTTPWGKIIVCVCIAPMVVGLVAAQLLVMGGLGSVQSGLAGAAIGIILAISFTRSITRQMIRAAGGEQTDSPGRFIVHEPPPDPPLSGLPLVGGQPRQLKAPPALPVPKRQLPPKGPR